MDLVRANARVRVYSSPRRLRAENPNNPKPSSAKLGGRNTHEIGVNCVILALHNTDSFFPF